MTTKPWVTLLICIGLCLFSINNGWSEASEEPLVGHAYYGNMTIPNNNSDVGGGDYNFNIFGADVQKAFGGEHVKYGVETGAYIGKDSSVRQFYASSGGTVAVSVEVKSLMIDYFLGGYIGIEPTKWFRLTIGAGPLLIWGNWETEPEESTPEDIVPESNSGFGGGLYARTGLDILFTENFGINAGARVNQTSLSLKDSAGDVDIEGWQYYLGVAFRF